MTGFRWTDDNRGQVTAEIHAAAGAAVDDALEHLLTEANKTVPLDESTLQRSGTVSREGTKGAVSYDTPYAVVQHESLELKHPGGRRAKWLELTLIEQAAAVRQYLAAKMRERIG